MYLLYMYLEDKFYQTVALHALIPDNCGHQNNASRRRISLNETAGEGGGEGKGKGKRFRRRDALFYPLLNV